MGVRRPMAKSRKTRRIRSRNRPVKAAQARGMTALRLCVRKTNYGKREGDGQRVVALIDRGPRGDTSLKASRRAGCQTGSRARARASASAAPGGHDSNLWARRRA